jgi:hypothetical protein
MKGQDPAAGTAAEAAAAEDPNRKLCVFFKFLRVHFINKIVLYRFLYISLNVFGFRDIFLCSNLVSKKL